MLADSTRWAALRKTQYSGHSQLYAWMKLACFVGIGWQQQYVTRTTVAEATLPIQQASAVLSTTGEHKRLNESTVRQQFSAVCPYRPTRRSLSFCCSLCRVQRLRR